MEEHLRECRECCARLEEIRELDSRLSSYSDESTSPDFTNQVLARLESMLEAEARPANDTFPREAWKQGHPANNRNSWIRPELVNALIATAATYLFLSTGMLKTILSLDWVGVGLGSNLILLQWVENLTQLFPL